MEDELVIAVLVNGERRTFVLPSHTGTVANALDRLDDWILTEDGGWVQKRFIVEVRPAQQDQQVERLRASRETP
jgi:hypothetical protein